jgi:hypothetical protein
MLFDSSEVGEQALSNFYRARISHDGVAAAAMLSSRSAAIWDLIALLARSGRPEDFEVVPFGVAKDALGARLVIDSVDLSADGRELFSAVVGSEAADADSLLATEIFDWSGDERAIEGTIEGALVFRFLFEENRWALDVTPGLELASRFEPELHESDPSLTELSRFDLLTEIYRGALGVDSIPQPPFPIDEPPLLAFAAPIWDTFLEAVDGSGWAIAADLVQFSGLLERAAQLARTGTRIGFDIEPFAEGLIAGLIRATDDPATADAVTALRLAIENHVITFLDRPASGAEWDSPYVDVLRGSWGEGVALILIDNDGWSVSDTSLLTTSADDYPTTSGISKYDRALQILAVVNELTGQSHDESLFEPP